MRGRIIEDEEPSQERPPTSTSPEQKPFSPSNLLDVGKDIGVQGAKGYTKGLLGSYGDILDFIGLQNPDASQAEQEHYGREYEYSPIELAALGTDEDILPRYSRLPTSSEIGKGLKSAGVPEASGFAGKASERVGQIFGGANSFGQGGLKGSLAAGVTGETLASMGAPGWLQALAEIVSFVKASPKNVPITSKTKEIKSALNDLKDSGFSKQDLTLAKNALEDRGWLKKSSILTPESEKLFKQTYASAEKAVKEAYEKGLPGLKEGGLENLKKASSELLDSVQQGARNIDITDSAPLKKAIDKSIGEMKRTLSQDPRSQEALTFLEDAKTFLNSNEQFPADYAIAWYRKINGSLGNWIDPKQKELILRDVKNAVKETFAHQGKDGKKLNQFFESANAGYMKYLDAEKAVDLIEKTRNTDGIINFRKLNNLLDNPQNSKLVEKALGSEQSSNLRQIAKTTDAIGDLEKVMKGGAVKEALGAGKLLGIGTALLTGNFGPLKAYVSVATISGISEKMLTDPKWQNMQLKLLKAVKDESPKAIQSATRQLESAVDAESKKDRPSKENNRRGRILED